MINMTKTLAAPEAQKVSKFARGRNRVAAALVTAGMTVGVPSAALADAPAGIEEVEAGFTSLQSTLTGVLIPAVIGLAVIGVVVVLGLRYLRRGARQA